MIVVAIVGLSVTNALPVVMASLSSFAIARGFGFFMSTRKKAKMETAVSTENKAND